MIDGVLPVHKPIGMSTFDVIRFVKRTIELEKKQKIGHAGTLDVFAEGVVLLLFGSITKEFAFFQEWEKEYVAGARLGYSSDTLDIEGRIVKQRTEIIPKRSEIKAAAKKYTGTFEQTIPSYSAAKKDGKPLYERARKGEMITKSKEVTVNEIEVMEYKFPLVSIRVSCQSGTYIRQLTYDIFRELTCDSFLWNLKRTRIGDISIDDCVRLDEIKLGNWKEFMFTTDRNEP